MKKNYGIVVLLLVSFFVMSAEAGVGKIVGMTAAEEADHIHIILDDNKMTGTVLVSGCTKCPLELGLKASSKLFYKNKTVSRKRVSKVSGKAGTVIFDEDTKKVIKVNW
jgi:hypothetical protein